MKDKQERKLWRIDRYTEKYQIVQKPQRFLFCFEAKENLHMCKKEKLIIIRLLESDFIVWILCPRHDIWYSQILKKPSKSQYLGVL